MKKLLYIICFIFLFINVAKAQEIEFIYVNGSNNNSIDSRQEFNGRVNKLHKDIIKAFNENEFVKSHLLENGKYTIDTTPDIFFWGDKSANNISILHKYMNFMKNFSPAVAQTIRSMFAYTMHDAIWIQKEYNMEKIVQDLHSHVLDAHKNNKKVILLGYSAGSFITYQYFSYKAPVYEYTRIPELMNLDKELTSFILKNPRKNTCLDAVTNSQLAVFTPNRKVVPNYSKEMFKQNYLNLDKATEIYCEPNDTVLGAINYASSTLLFYSDDLDNTLEINKTNEDFYRYLKKHNVFLLTVNFAEDPLGYPLAANITNKDIEESTKVKLNDGHGFVYDKSDLKSSATFIGAHKNYFKDSKKFSKAIATGYEEGYKYFYSTNDKK